MTPSELRQFRHRLRLTQAQFADVVGVAPNTVARWERGVLGMRKSVAILIDHLVKNIDLTNPEVPPNTPASKEKK